MMTANDAVRLDYGYMSTGDYPNYVFAISHGDVSMTVEDFTCSNGRINTFNYGGVRTVVNFTPADPHKPVQLFYKGWLIMVCNY